MNNVIRWYRKWYRKFNRWIIALFIRAYLGLVFRGGRWIRCVRQRAPRRGTVPQSRQGRAKPLRHENLLLLPIFCRCSPRRLLGPPPRVSPSSRRSHVLFTIPQQDARNPLSVVRHGDDRSRGSREIHQSAASCRWLCPAPLINHHIHHCTLPPPSHKPPVLYFTPFIFFPIPIGTQSWAKCNKINHYREYRLLGRSISDYERWTSSTVIINENY